MRFRAIKVTIRKVGTGDAEVFIQSLSQGTGAYVGSSHQLADTTIKRAIAEHIQFARENDVLVAKAQAMEELAMSQPGFTE